MSNFTQTFRNIESEIEIKWKRWRLENCETIRKRENGTTAKFIFKRESDRRKAFYDGFKECLKLFEDSDENHFPHK